MLKKLSEFNKYKRNSDHPYPLNKCHDIINRVRIKLNPLQMSSIDSKICNVRSMFDNRRSNSFRESFNKTRTLRTISYQKPEFQKETNEFFQSNSRQIYECALSIYQFYNQDQNDRLAELLLNHHPFFQLLDLELAKRLLEISKLSVVNSVKTLCRKDRVLQDVVLILAGQLKDPLDQEFLLKQTSLINTQCILTASPAPRFIGRTLKTCARCALLKLSVEEFREFVNECRSNSQKIYRNLLVYMKRCQSQ